MLVLLPVVLLALVYPLATLATPVPLPMPLALMAPDFSSRFMSPNQALNSMNLTSSVSDLGENANSSHHFRDTPSHQRRSVYNMEERSLNALSDLHGYYSKARDHSNNLKSYAAQSAYLQEADFAFQQGAVAELTAFDSSLLGIKTILDQLGAEKGLLNYDRTNDLETLLKNVVNFNKETLNAVDALVYNLPILGPVLGPSKPQALLFCPVSILTARDYPVVYELKCLLDDVLNAVENLTDALINGLQPLLQALIGQASTTACRSGVELLGLCI
ncbi:hypothetical protein CC1G_11309 [Coprinopsis cinerea okayama7|uniref:Uncharacterized protein n=1 Tax=Coprinopsis cinerea (strain Okayama-7 / 130 / ATCC MYA-4618 / FGSC 9003) TaxID=240176 RepID=A8N1H0_COPC7|nr:hypothetical protein CC1G_11309 [Coprinopsis cinerea okayama7\|eukprot:XP_001828719.2 hypothetical protein CC1G_11309 [Coprinopsis cinerea okayama7\